MEKKRRNRIYDHRLVQLVRDTGDIAIATGLGVPRSTAAGWLRRAGPAVTTPPRLYDSCAELRARIARLKKRVRLLRAIVRVMFALLRMLQPDLTRLRVPQAPDEMYFGKGESVPDQLETARQDARAARLEINRARRCGACG